MNEPNNEQTKPDKCCMTCFHRKEDYCKKHKMELTIDFSYGDVSLWEQSCFYHKEKEEEK